ncbi:MUC5B protein, partial [Columbina picui]|nr:MUC5B protein [Columbina picui]
CCHPPDCTCEWTDWIDVSYPDGSDKDGGDDETFENIQKHNASWICVKAENISCRAERFPDVPIEDLGQIVTCDVSTGLICNNRDQTVGGPSVVPVCYNYQISVCCTPNRPECIPSTTASTTTAPPSSTTSTMSSTPRPTTTPTPTSSKPPTSTSTTSIPPSSTSSSTPTPPPSSTTSTMSSTPRPTTTPTPT